MVREGKNIKVGGIGDLYCYNYYTIFRAGYPLHSSSPVLNAFTTNPLPQFLPDTNTLKSATFFEITYHRVSSLSLGLLRLIVCPREFI